MTVRPYKPKDFEQVKAWGLQWGAEYSEDQFPKNGFIVDGIAAYFIYSTDSSVCWLENLISNKVVEHNLRCQALDLIIAATFKEAKRLGFKVAYATTDIREAALRGKAHGARIKANQLLLTKDLTQI